MAQTSPHRACSSIANESGRTSCAHSRSQTRPLSRCGMLCTGEMSVQSGHALRASSPFRPFDEGGSVGSRIMVYALEPQSSAVPIGYPNQAGHVEEGEKAMSSPAALDAMQSHTPPALRKKPPKRTNGTVQSPSRTSLPPRNPYPLRPAGHTRLVEWVWVGLGTNAQRSTTTTDPRHPAWRQSG